MINPNRSRVLVFFYNADNLRQKLKGLNYNSSISGEPFLYNSTKTNVQYIFLHAPNSLLDVDAISTHINSMIQPGLILVNDEILSTATMHAIFELTRRLKLGDPQILESFK